jgi:hypothetical protein
MWWSPDAFRDLLAMVPSFWDLSRYRQRLSVLPGGHWYRLKRYVVADAVIKA